MVERRRIPAAVCGAAVLMAATGAPASPEHAARPSLVCDAPVYDFGRRPDTETVAHDFVIRNDGSMPVTVWRVHSSCGCMAAVPKPRVIPPGGTGVVHATLALAGRRGPQRKSLTIEAKEPGMAAPRLWLMGDVASEIALDPPYVNFGQVAADVETSRIVSLVTTKAGARLGEVSGSSPDFSVAIEPPGSEGPGATNLVVKTAPPLSPGVKEGRIRVTVVGSVERTLDIGVTAVVDSPLRVFPREITLHREGGAGQHCSILLLSGQAAPF